MFELLKRKRGLILMAVVLWSASMAGLVFLFVNNHLQDQRLFRDAEDETKALWLAYGGIHKGLQTLSQNPKFRGPMEPEALNGGEIRISVLEKNGKVSICSEGTVHQVTLEVVKEMGKGSAKDVPPQE